MGYSLSHRFILLRFIASNFLALHLPLSGSVSGPSRNTLDAGEAKGVKFMGKQLETNTHDDLISSSVPFVQALARRLATSMPHSIEIGDLVQDGMIGLIDAANRFDEKRGIKFETFAFFAKVAASFEVEWQVSTAFSFNSSEKVESKTR